MIADPREIQRLRHTPGQDLLARDFRDAETFAARLREWHNRALHKVFGVSLGLNVEELASSEDFVVVQAGPGLAYDATGRELILSAPRAIRSVPLWHLEPVLVIRSGPGGAAELAWSSADRLRPCDNVPIARLLSGFAGPMLDPSFLPPRTVRALARPRIGQGGTTVGGTAWRAEVVSESSQVIALLAGVDTRAAGFTGQPCYFAWLQGGLPYPVRIGGSGSSYKLVPLPLHPSLEEENQAGFRLRVLAKDLNDQPAAELRRQVLAAAQTSLALCWLGIQMPSETQSFEVGHGNP